MSFTQSILLELFKAVLAGTFAAGVFVFGQCIQRFVLEPVAEMRKLIAQIGYDLYFYGNLWSGPEGVPDPEWNKATAVYRGHAASLTVLPRAIPFYDSLASFLSLPCAQQAREASKCLTWLSNFDKTPNHDDHAYKRDQVSKLKELLKLPET